MFMNNIATAKWIMTALSQIYRSDWQRLADLLKEIKLKAEHFKNQSKRNNISFESAGEKWDDLGVIVKAGIKTKLNLDVYIKGRTLCGFFT